MHRPLPRVLAAKWRQNRPGVRAHGLADTLGYPSRFGFEKKAATVRLRGQKRVHEHGAFRSRHLPLPLDSPAYTAPRGRVVFSVVKHKAVIILAYILVGLVLITCGGGLSEPFEPTTPNTIAFSSDRAR